MLSRLRTATAQAPAEEPENYCNDKESWAEWSDLVAKYPNDEDLQTLHALSKSPVSRAAERGRRLVADQSLAPAK